MTSTVIATDPDFPYESTRMPASASSARPSGRTRLATASKIVSRRAGRLYQFVPKTVTATQLSFSDPDDGYSLTAPLGFSFVFYGQSYAQVYVNTNGLVSFDQGSPEYANRPIPTAVAPNDFASCFWRDQSKNTASQGVWMQTFGSAPNRTALIYFILSDYDGAGSAPYTYEMILHESTNTILCQYADTSSILVGGGGHASIGLESPDGTSGLQYYYAADERFETAGPIENGLALLFTPGATAVPVYSASSKDIAYHIHPGEVTTYTIAIRNSGSANGNATTLNDPIPAGATYVPGSATVVGGGSLSANASAVQWSGAVPQGAAITVTYRVTLPLSANVILTNSATISDPAALAPAKPTVGQLIAPPSSGGPDAFGYRYKDNFASGGPVFNWLSRTLTATELITTGDDDVVTGPIPLNFNFGFYGVTYTNFYVNSNGQVLFGADSASNTNYPIPTPSAPNNFAACFWSDLVAADDTQGAWSQTFGNAPNRATVVTFRMNEYGAPDPAAAREFQTIFYETNNRVACQYLDMGGTISGTGSIATAGLEGPDGTAGIQYWDSFDTDYLTVGPFESGLVVLYTPDASAHAVFANSDVQVSAGQHPGEVITYSAHLRNSGPALSAVTAFSDIIPSGALYVPSSATVVGGGVLSANASSVSWAGPVASGGAVTITFRVTLSALSGTVVNNATINSAAVVSPTNLSVSTQIQPYRAPALALAPYRYRDSYAPNGPTFAWQAPSGSAVQLFPLVSDDSISGPIPLNFNFAFYGQTYTQVVVSTNGLVMFNRAGATDSVNAPIPVQNYVNNFATCFWDNQVTYSGGGVWFETQGTAGNRTAIITFQTYQTIFPLDPPLIYQMILSENGNRIKCQYQQMNGAPYGDGSFATVGIQNIRSDDGLQYSYGFQGTQPGPIENRLAIEFIPLSQLYLPLIQR